MLWDATDGKIPTCPVGVTGSIPVGTAKVMLTKEQFVLLENFGLHRIEDHTVDVETLRRAVHAAVLVLPFDEVEGMLDKDGHLI